LKIDVELVPESLSSIPLLAGKAEEFGFDCIWANETKHDPFVQLVLASQTTHEISLGTSIALAFTRSPMAIAYTAWDIQSMSGGRLILGLGSQVKGHIERRFGVKWASPEPKMREVVMSMRSIWKSWQTGDKLDFRGEFFTINLMTPFFNPGPIQHPEIPVYIAGVNRGMCRLAGEVGDGLHVHPLHTLKYLQKVVVPEVSRGLASSGRKRNNISVAASVFAAVGDDEPSIRRMRVTIRDQIAFYASTRTYRRVMELHGWEDVCDTLHEYSTRGRWDIMGEQITDEMLGEFVVEGSWRNIGERIHSKYDGIVDRVRLYLPFDGRSNWRMMLEGMR
jgi:probable F420-dependent oxidoreductase